MSRLALLPRIVRALMLALAIGLAAPSAAQDWTAPAGVVAPAVELPLVPEDWLTVEGTWLEVRGPPDAYPLLLEVSRHGSDSLPRFADELAVPIGDTVYVYIAPTQRAFHELQPGNAPEWADGTAYPSIGAIFLRRPVIRGPAQRPLQVVLDHEIVHVLLGRTFEPHQPPRWLQEGLAQVLAGEHDPQVVHELARGLASGELLTLEELTYGFPNDAGRARLAYAQSADFIDWIRATHGPESIQVLVREMAASGDVRRAVRAATGLSLEEVDQAWRSRFTEGAPLWIAALASMDMWWGALGVIAFIGLLLAYRRRKRRMQDYARDEADRDALLRSLLARLWRERGSDDSVH